MNTDLISNNVTKWRQFHREPVLRFYFQGSCGRSQLCIFVYVDVICPGVCNIKIISLPANLCLYNNSKNKEE
jgi:hypothetical protein